MSLLIKASRLALFGVDMSKKKPTIQTVATTWAMNRGRRLIGLPEQKGHSLWDWLMHQGQLLLADWLGWNSEPSLPDDLPVALFNIVDQTLRNRGGQADKEHDLFNYWLDSKAAQSTPFFWSLQVDYAPGADPTKVTGFEMALEDQLTKAGFDYNVRIQKRPLRIEIDKPSPPTVTLAELWTQIEGLEQNKRMCLIGLAYLAGQTANMTMTLENFDASVFIAGSPGSGKTQLSMSIILTLAMSNSPKYMSMVIIDPKGIDYHPFNALPHLALPVINDPYEAVEAINALCAELDRRQAKGGKGNRSFFDNPIMVYIDELADLISKLPPAEAEQIMTGIRRLAQSGRGVGFITIGATQRVFSVPTSLISELNAKFAGRTRNAQDSVAISGVPGTTTNKLPGKGSFELYCSDQQGLRIQAPFVAASDKADYEIKLQPFFRSINQRWRGQRPGWRPEAIDRDPIDEEVMTDDFMPEVEAVQVDAPAIDPALLAALKVEYKANPETFTQRTVRRVYAALNSGQRMYTVREKRIYEQFLRMAATDFA